MNTGKHSTQTGMEFELLRTHPYNSLDVSTMSSGCQCILYFRVISFRVASLCTKY